jgi:hypothetical protein
MKLRVCSNAPRVPTAGRERVSHRRPADPYIRKERNFSAFRSFAVPVDSCTRLPSA